MQQVHPTTNSSAASSAVSADRRLELLHQQLLEQNRRAATPFSHPLSGMGALHKLREHIQDLSRLADAAILNAESAPANIAGLDEDLRALLKTQDIWTDRLENQIWRLESQAKWHKQLKALSMLSGPSKQAVDDFCSRLAGETCSLPTGLLLLPEPGLSFTPARRIDGWSQQIAWGLEAIRLALFCSPGLFPHGNPDGSKSTQLIACMWIVSTEPEVAADSSQTEVQSKSLENPLTESFGAQLNVPEPGERTRMIRFCSRVLKLMKTIQAASLSAIDRLIPPDLVDHYSRACRSLFTASLTNEQTPADRSSERADTIAMVQRLGLFTETAGPHTDSTAAPQADSSGRLPVESMEFTGADGVRLRIHSGDGDWQRSRSTARSSEGRGELRPKIFLGDHEFEVNHMATETAKTAELARDY